MNRDEVLAAYDEQVRRSTAADGTGAVIEVAELIVRRLASRGTGGSGVLWSALDATTADAVIAAQIEFFGGRGEEFEWKLYDYDEPADLAQRLASAGLRAEPAESLMVAATADALAGLRDADPPPGVTIVPVTDAAGVDMLADVHELVFGGDESHLRASLRAQLKTAPELAGPVLAMAGDQPVSAARIEFPPGCEFAGLWGGGTLPQWRRRGIYRALVRYRAELAVERGVPYLTVDASEQSRPVLERVGFTRLATTTPYIWEPPGEA